MVLGEILRFQSMAATVLNDSDDAVSVLESPYADEKVDSTQIELEIVKCDCCAFTEECTPAYIHAVREKHEGRWLCGLCSEAIKDEISRSERDIGSEEALNRHMNFCKKFRSAGPPPDMTDELISNMKQLFRRSLSSSQSVRSTPGCPSRKEGSGCRPSVVRSTSCFSAIDGPVAE